MAKLLDTYKKSLEQKAYGSDIFNYHDYVHDFMDKNNIQNFEARVTPKGERKYKVDGKKMSSEEFDRTYCAGCTIDLITAASMTETDNDVMDAISKLSSPENMSREEASELYEETLGYDPITYYDKFDLSCLLDLAENNANVEISEELHDEVINTAIRIYDEGRRSNQLLALKTAVVELNTLPESLVNELSNMIGSMVDGEEYNFSIDELDVETFDDDDDEFELVDEPEEEYDEYDD